jgi:2-polyprenyl-3-methyl-5-hydroxy-6-metoxy-1,4-benzoquinol methylase
MSGDVTQDKIWSFYQGEGVQSFSLAAPRMEFLAKRIMHLAKTARPKVLNIGLGDGYFERFMLRVGAAVSTLDPDAEAIARICSEGIDGRAGRIEQMPLESASYDFVVASEVLEHLTDEQRSAGIKEIQRVLCPAGYFLGTMPYREILKEQTCVCPDCGNVFHRWGHKKSFDLQSTRAELEPLFKVVRLTRTAFPGFRRSPVGILKGVSLIFLAKLGQPIAVPRIVFIAQRGQR